MNVDEAVRYCLDYHKSNSKKKYVYKLQANP